MATTEVLAFPANCTGGDAFGSPTTLPLTRTIGLDEDAERLANERILQWRLKQVARAWIELCAIKVCWTTREAVGFRCGWRKLTTAPDPAAGSKYFIFFWSITNETFLSGTNGLVARKAPCHPRSLPEMVP